jgi:low temperature requirement protein LtrA
VQRSQFLRDRDRPGSSDVTTTELFFDLVYVFTFVQLSGFLYDNLSAAALLQAAVLVLGVWWAWNYTAWATNWLDTGRAPATLLIAVLMVLGLLMASAIPDAFDHGHSRAETFAAAYVAMQILRSAVMVWAFGPGLKDRMARNYAQLLVWSCVAAVPWLIGGFVTSDHLRLILWLVAIVIDMLAPMVGFWLPGAGGAPMSRWTLAGEHLAERCHLVLIIAFGESVLRVGESFVDAHGKPGVDIAFLIGFLLTFALWAAYFLGQAEHGMARMGSADQAAARIGRSGYTYAHALMVGGVLAAAVGIHLAIEDPGEHVSVVVAVDFLIGPALYLVGMVLYTRSVGGHHLETPVIAIAALAILGIPAAQISRLALLVAVTVVSVALALVTLRHRAGEPLPT